MNRSYLVACIVVFTATSIIHQSLSHADDDVPAGYWISRTAKPASDAILLTLDKPVIESNGNISIPRPQKPVFNDKERIKARKARRQEFGDGNIGQTRFSKIDSAMAKVLIGRKIERGQRAFVHLPPIDVIDRDENVPAGDRAQITR
jgi:hypothetical protein